MIKFAPFEFDTAAGLVYRDTEETLLPPKPAGVLQMLLENAEQLVTKDDLLETVWPGSHVTESSLTDAVSVLRQVLGDDPRDPTYIQTLHRRGYRFIGAVEQQPSEDPTPGGSGVPVQDANAAPDSTSPEGHLAPGVRLGDYEILSTLGGGAMGVVYRARDSTLEREVAIKVLREGTADDQEGGARLQREAKLVAGVSHPNIAAIHSLDEADGIKFAVLELVEGQTLEERLQAGRLGVEQALKIGAQIAAALEAAHHSGTIHRDLKPANIKLTPAGQVKVLDFGLAQALQVSVFGDDADSSPTASLTIKGTGRGSIVGTVAYMSPEQARGQDLDKQADIWSFGCVLYELLSGRRAFSGDTITDTLAAVVDRDPDWEALPADTPFLARALLRRCLQKDPGRRLHDIADARIEIEEALEAKAIDVPPAEPQDGARGAGQSTVDPAWRVASPRIAATLALGAFLGAAGLWTASSPAPGPVTRATVDVEAGLRLSGGEWRERDRRSFSRPGRSAMAISPDGKHLVYLAADLAAEVAGELANGVETRQLYRREMNRGHATPIDGTEGASDPFFSPDGQWVGFVAAGGLKKVPVGGGDPVTVFPDWDEPHGGASWGDDGTIVVAHRRGGLFSGPATGGTPQPLTTLDADRGETSHRLPHMLPGSKAVLFTVLMTPGDWDRGEITVQSLATGERKELIVGGSDARYVPTGHLVFARDGALMAVGFDPERLEVSGEPVEIIDDVLHSVDHGQWFLNTGTAHIAFSDTGTLVYAAGGAYPEVMMSLLRVDRNGEPQPFPLPQRRYLTVRLSPDGKQLVYTAGPGDRLDVWKYDIERGIPTIMTTRGLSNREAPWSPDGEWIAFGSNRDGSVRNLYVMAADGSGDPRRLTTSDRDQTLSSWSVDGVIAFLQDDDIWVLPDPLDPASEAYAFIESTFVERFPTFSPDGKWLAYTSNESGQHEVYVRPYPGPEPATAITGGGRREAMGLAWSHDGRELYLKRNGDARRWAVEMAYGPTLEPGATNLVFARSGYSGLLPVRSYDVDADGDFLMVSEAPPTPQPVTQLNVVLNWFEELKELVPTGR